MISSFVIYADTSSLLSGHRRACQYLRDAAQPLLVQMTDAAPYAPRGWTPRLVDYRHATAPGPIVARAVDILH